MFFLTENFKGLRHLGCHCNGRSPSQLVPMGILDINEGTTDGTVQSLEKIYGDVKGINPTENILVGSQIKVIYYYQSS